MLARAPKLISLVLVIGFLLGCAHRRDPAAAFSHARQTYRHGDIAAAGDEAEQGYKDFHAVNSDWAWQFIILRARVLLQRRKAIEALALLMSAPGDPPSVDLAVQRLRLESDCHAFLGQFGPAEHDLADAERLCPNSLGSVCGDLASARGALEMFRGNYTKAQALFEQALSSARTHREPFFEASALLNLSWAADSQTRFDEALDWANSAREIAVPSDFAGVAQKALGNMGWAYYRLGDPEKAEGMFVDARKRAEELDEIPEQILWLQASSYVYLDELRIFDADRSSRQAIDLARKANSKNDIIDSLTALAFVSEQAGKLEEAKRYTDEAVAIGNSDRKDEFLPYLVLVKGRIAARQHDAAAAEAAFRQVEQSEFTPVFLKWEAERASARLYEDENRPDTDTEYRTALSTFEAARCDLRRIDTQFPFPTNGARIYEDYIHFLVARGKINQALQVADYARARILAEGVGRACKAKFAPDVLDAPAIARRAGGTILFYALGNEHSYLWAITPHQVRLFPLTANQSEIDAAVQRYRKKLEGPPAILEASNDGSTLYKMLVEPAQDLLKKESLANNSNVFIIPDSGLNSLNFETLVPENAEARASASQPKHYWIEDVTIANAASLGMLPASRGRSSNLGGNLLLIGNSVAPFAGPDNLYPELPNSAAQMENIEKYFPANRQQVFTRQQALPAAYLHSHPEKFSYIHFVAHGFASRVDPLDSAIILSRDPASNAAQDDSFKLYARDIIGTPPLRADMVTISACQSTGTRTYSGEGLVGLSWAFLRAGAHNVVGALWDVSDTSTARLMDNFYGELKRGRPPEVALRSAKLAMLHTNEASHRPFYWAPFQLYTGGR
jgi:CHAT domain-containing protein